MAFFQSLPGSIYYNVQNYGAKGDGSTDDTSAISATITACLAGGGGVVFFPAGTYITSSQVTIGGNNVTLMGTGIGSVVKAKSTADFTLMLYATGRTGLCIKDMVFDANQASRVGILTGIGGAISLSTCTDCFVINVIVKNTIGYTAISAAAFALNGTRIQAIGCTAEDCGIAGKTSDGFFTAGTQILTVGCIAKNATDTGFVISNGQQCGIGDCTAIGCGAGAAIVGASSGDTKGNFIDGLTVYDYAAGTTGGVQILNASSGNVLDTRLSNINIKNVSALGPGLFVRTTSSGVITGITLDGVSIDATGGSQALVITATNINISNCYFKTGGTTVVQFQSGCSSVVMTGCQIYGSGTFGLQLTGGSDYVITNNIITSSGLSYGFFCNNTATNVDTSNNTFSGSFSQWQIGAQNLTAPRLASRPLTRILPSSDNEGYWDLGTVLLNPTPGATAHAIAGWVVTVAGVQSAATFTPFYSGNGSQAFSVSGTLTSAAAGTAVHLIADALVGAAKKCYIAGFRAKVNGATPWATTATVSIQDTAGSPVSFVDIAVAAMTANALIIEPSSNITLNDPFILGTGGTAAKGIDVKGNANGTGSDLVVTIWGVIK